MSLSLGEKLRQAREERGISISEVSEQTRISPLYLESIENDDYKPLPGGIFNKGFVKSYAKFIGIDEQEALRDYSAIVAPTQESEGELRRYRSEVLTDDNSGRSMIPTYIFAGIILALMTAGLLWVVNYIQNQPESPTLTSNSNAANVTDGQAVVPTPDPAVPSFTEISMEFAAISEPVNLTTVVDGKRAVGNVEPGKPRAITASESVQLSYYRGFAEKVQIKLNGKEIAPPPAPARGNIISVDINKTNAPEIWQAGTFAIGSEATPPAETSSAQPTPARTVAVPKPSPSPISKPVASGPTAPSTPRTSQRQTTPTPLIIGKPSPSAETP
ncbi:MAG: helix-turn-helix domain-containing protein [Blastocatellia bacterium]|nr:helix-turn-helix domain-containing protein [Blastocatellia bacterium]